MPERLLRRLTAGCVVGLLVVGCTPEDPSPAGNTMSASKPKQLKWPELHKRADDGDRDAMLELGENWEDESNWKEAAKYYRMAGEKGDVAAMYSLGRLHLDERIPDSSEKEAKNWLGKAADAGNKGAQQLLITVLSPDEIKVKQAYWRAKFDPPDPEQTRTTVKAKTKSKVNYGVKPQCMRCFKTMPRSRWKTCKGCRTGKASAKGLKRPKRNKKVMQGPKGPKKYTHWPNKCRGVNAKCPTALKCHKRFISGRQQLCGGFTCPQGEVCHTAWLRFNSCKGAKKCPTPRVCSARNNRRKSRSRYR